MRIRRLFHTAAALLAFLAIPASAQNCAVIAPSAGYAGFGGFTDLPASSPFCPNVEWVRNRGITLGCGAGTTYCPNDAVTRLQMAIFLNRMGDKLTPTIIEPVPSVDSVSQVNLTTPQVVCSTGDFVIAADSYPRRAHFNGRVNLYNPSANGDFVSEMVYTVTDAGQPPSTTWIAVQNTAAYQTLYTGFTPAHDVSTYPQGYLNLDVNKTYKFGMRVSRYTGTTANVAVFCVNMVSVASRSGAARPFDEAEYTPPADALPPQGRALPRP